MLARGSDCRKHDLSMRQPGSPGEEYDMGKYVILVESGADPTSEMVEKYHFHVVPMHVQLGDITKDDRTFPIEEVFECYEKTGILPKTSASGVHDFEVMYDKLHAEYPDSKILYLAYSAVTTCSYQNGVLAAEGRDYIIPVDTKQVSGAQSMVAVLMAEYLEQNPEASPEQVKEYAEKIREKVHFSFIPGGLKYLRAGGRVSNPAYIAAKILSILPLIDIENGYLVATKKYRGPKSKIFSKYIKEYDDRWHFDRRRVFACYGSGLSDEHHDMIEALLRKMGFKEIDWVQTGAVVSSHGGPGAFGLCGVEQF